MKKTGLCILALCSAACATAGRTYPLGLSADQGNAMTSPLLACASQSNLQSRQNGDGVDILVDEASMLHFGNSGDGYAMSVAVDEKRVPQDQVGAKLDSVKVLGDHLYACANGASTVSSSAPAGGNIPADLQYQGNWMAHVEYKYSCSMPMNKPEEGRDTGSWSVTISGTPQQLAAQVNTSPSGFSLNGSSSTSGLRLCGAFPLKGKGNVANTRDNNVCMVVSEAMSPTQLRGHLEGEYQTPTSNCKIHEARLELTR